MGHGVVQRVGAVEIDIGFDQVVVEPPRQLVHVHAGERVHPWIWGAVALIHPSAQHPIDLVVPEDIGGDAQGGASHREHLWGRPIRDELLQKEVFSFTVALRIFCSPGG